jgi:hypothetical protein
LAASSGHVSRSNAGRSFVIRHSSSIQPSPSSVPSCSNIQAAWQRGDQGKSSQIKVNPAIFHSFALEWRQKMKTR